MTQDDGFTLVELAVLMVILGLLAASIFPLYTITTKRQRILNTKDKALEVKTALIQYYRDHLSLPAPSEGSCGKFEVPYTSLGLPPPSINDAVTGACFMYVSTNKGHPFKEIFVDGRSIGETAAVIVSKGFNATFDYENANPGNGRFQSQSNSEGFDDILISLSESELKAATWWVRQVWEDIADLNSAAKILALNDDDNDGQVDEDPPGSMCGIKDPPGNCDGKSNWTRINRYGVDALLQAGLLRTGDRAVDPWGTSYIWDSHYMTFYSAGPNKKDEGGKGDDLHP